MYLLLSIFLSAVLGLVLLMIHPVFGGVLVFGIVVGCMFRGLYSLNDIHKKVCAPSAKEDKVNKAYREYLEGKIK